MKRVMVAVAAIALAMGSAEAQTSAANVSSGAFGANTGGGDYSFPGKVGVGVSPTSPLHVASPGGSQSFNFVTSSSGTSYLFGLLQNTGAQLLLGVLNSSDGSAVINHGKAYASVVGSFNNTPLQLFTNSTARMTFDTAGNAGIGTNAPTLPLDVAGLPDVSVFPNNPVTLGVRDTNDPTVANTGSGISFMARYGTAGLATIGAISAVRESTTASDYSGALVFGARTNGTYGNTSMEKMRIRSTGEVVIGPTGGTGQRLTVNGDVAVTGNIGAKFQDLAEWVPSANDLEPGTVVVLDPSVSNQVMASSRPYDTTVAGVVSQQPGIILGEGGAEKEQVATTGRVRVRADATAAPIRIGDLLVTSGKSGTAMRSQPVEVSGIELHRPGTVIGKALEPLASGTGEILVLLSLQ